MVGTSHRRVEGRSKVTGAAIFTGDLRLPDLAHARLILSPHAHAEITSIRLDAAGGHPGVILAAAAADLPEAASAAEAILLARGRVRYAGEPVAVIVADSATDAADAAELVEVEYGPLPAVLDPESAMREGAPDVLPPAEAGVSAEAAEHGASTAAETVPEDRPANTSAVAKMAHGDVEAALAGCAAVVHRTYRLGFVHQGFLEPHVSAARVEPDGTVMVWTSTQGAFDVRREVSSVLGVPQSRVRVTAMAVGGGFGGKFTLLEGLVAVLARRTRRPVRLALTRNEEFLLGRGAPACSIELTLGATASGDLAALKARIVYDNGVTAGFHAGFSGFLMLAPYRIGAFQVEAFEVATNKTPTTAYRAPASPQAAFALESAVDELAGRLRIDPVELRLRNAVKEGDPDPQGGRWPAIALRDCLEAVRVHPLYTASTGEGEGVGFAIGLWPGGYEPAAAACRVESDGTLTLQLGSVDISGTDTTFALMAAEAFGVDPSWVTIQKGDTGMAPYAGGAGGSKTTYSVGPAVLAAAQDARRQLLEIAAETLEAAPEDLRIEEGEIRVAGVPGRSVPIADVAAKAYVFGGSYAPILGQGRAAIHQGSPMFTAHIARVKVDRETGAFALTGYAAIQDVGRAINPAEVHGQVHGGALQGLGRALGEELAWDAEGQMRTASFLDYRLPSIDQAPDTAVDLIEVPSAVGPLGAKGVGEPPAVPGPAALANAIHAATGWRPESAPIDPDQLRRALGG